MEPTIKMEILGGVVYIIPCHSCSEYELCLNRRSDVVLEHILNKATAYLSAKMNGLKVATSLEEWKDEVAKLVGAPILPFGTVLFAEREDGLWKLGMGFKHYGYDGMTVLLIEELDSGRKVVLFGDIKWMAVDENGILWDPQLHPIWQELKDYVNARAVEFMETHPKGWDSLIEDFYQPLSKEVVK